MTGRILKKLFISDLAPGAEVDDVFVAVQKQMALKKDGAPFMKLRLSDATGQVQAVAWDNVDAMQKAFDPGDFVHIKGRASQYRDELQVIVSQAARVEPLQVDRADFLPATTKDTAVMLDRLTGLIRKVRSPTLRGLLDAFFNDPDFVNLFSQAPAAKKMHHAYIGGLLEHTLSVTLLADMIASHFQGVDRDLLITGAVLHDVGKVEELACGAGIDYSDAGRLLSHIVLGLEMINKRMAQVDNPHAESLLQLKHLVVSHHGERQFGAPEVPKTLEALILNAIDDLDAKVVGVRKFMENHPENDAWSSWHRLLERQFYRRRRAESEGDGELS